MNLNEYQNQAMSFRLKSANALYAVFNLGGEVGELQSLIAKGIRDGAKEDYFDNVKKELGDILWHVAAVAMDNGFSLDEIGRENIAKLSSRKKRGKIQGSGDAR